MGRFLRSGRVSRLPLHRFEYVVPLLFFFGGATWDALTLQRIDALLDNLILGVYLVLLGGFVVLATLARTDRPLPAPLRRLTPWAPGIIQVLAGARLAPTSSTTPAARRSAPRRCFCRC